MLQPKHIEIDGYKFVISKFDAWSGREIVTQYPLTGLPKLGDYKSNAEIALKLMCFVCADTSGGQVALTNVDLIKNHVPNWEVQLKLEWAMMEYNCTFFQGGRISTFFGDLGQKLPAFAFKMWTAFSEQFLQKGKLP